MDSGNDDPVAIHIGGRIRVRRKMAGLSQEGLGRLIGISFQQVQKYENAGLRLTAALLYRFCNAVDVPIQYFFEGLNPLEPEDGSDDQVLRTFLATPEAIELAQIFPRLKSARQRRKFIDLLRATVEAGQADT